MGCDQKLLTYQRPRTPHPRSYMIEGIYTPCRPGLLVGNKLGHVLCLGMHHELDTTMIIAIRKDENMFCALTDMW